MSKFIEVKFIYSDLMDLNHFSGTRLIEGEEYMLRYKPDDPVYEYRQTGVYRMVDGGLKMDELIHITGDSYLSINRSDGVTERVDSRHGMTINRYDKRDRDLVQIIKNSLVEWVKIQ
jgi:hypothetical protein